jgi:iron complex transport system substrate-binding protein
MAVLVLLVAASAVAALWRPMPPAGAPASPTRSVVDERGRVVALPQAVQTAAVFMAIGAGEYLLVTRRPSDIMTSHSPENARLKASTLLARAFPDLRWLRTTMSSVETGMVNVETLLRDRPDVVVTWARLAAGFERVGLPVVGLGPLSSTERLAQNTAVFSAIVDEPARGADLVQRSYSERARVSEDVALRTSGHTRVLRLIPRGQGRWQAISGFADVIAQAGGVDVQASARLHAPLDAERLLVLAPEVILVVGGVRFDDDAPRRLMQTPALATVPAVRERRVYRSPPGVTGFMASVIEMPIYLRWLAEVLHPGSLAPEARDFARRILTTELGVTPTDAELDDALASAANRYSAPTAQSGPGTR